MNGVPPSPQEPNPSPPTGSHFNNNYVLQILILGLIVVIFCAILIILLLLCVYVLMSRRVSFVERSRRSSWLRRREEISTSRARVRGLDAKIVEALPTFIYTSQNLEGEEKLECTICLSEFVEGDKLRVLPNCKHSFHIECIATWFSAHSNCPVCRTNLDAQALLVDNIDDAPSSNGTDNAVVVVNIGVTEEGQSNATGFEDGPNNFSSPRESKATSSPRASHSGRFSRLHSFKRMLSRGREEEDFPTSLHQTPNQSEGPSHF